MKFFSNKDTYFIGWIAPLLKNMQVFEGEYIYKRGDPINEVYFLSKGLAGYVLP